MPATFPKPGDIVRVRSPRHRRQAGVYAYRWTDIPTTCEFLLDYEEDEEPADPGTGKAKRPKKKPYRYRWPDEIRDEVLARLLELNQKRHEEEVARGVAPGKGRNPEGKTQRGKAEDELL